VIFPDVNVLIYAHDATSEFHRAASAWWEEALANDQVFFSWQTICGFLRIATSHRIFVNPLTLPQAVGIVESWLELENTHIISLDKRNWPLFAKTLIDGQASGNLVMDAHIAAMAASCGVAVATIDRDFLRFSSVRTVDPISKT